LLNGPPIEKEEAQEDLRKKVIINENEGWEEEELDLDLDTDF